MLKQFAVNVVARLLEWKTSQLMRDIPPASARRLFLSPQR
jgi:hypothetical protein